MGTLKLKVFLGGTAIAVILAAASGPSFAAPEAPVSKPVIATAEPARTPGASDTATMPTQPEATPAPVQPTTTPETTAAPVASADQPVADRLRDLADQLAVIHGGGQ